MPFTPYHLGPGLLLKAASPRHFSFLAYAASQVVIDVESGYHLLSGNFPVHRGLHTFVLGGLAGALTGAVIGVIGPRIVRAGFAREVSLRPAMAGGIAGGLLHALLDGIMHADIRPFRPLLSGNPLLGLLARRAAPGLYGSGYSRARAVAGPADVPSSTPT